MIILYDRAIKVLSLRILFLWKTLFHFLIYVMPFVCLSGRIGKCLACFGCTLEFRWGCTHLYYARGAQGGTAHEGRGCDLSIGSAVPDAIVRSWLWLTETRSSPLGCFSTYCKLLIIDPTFCGRKFSTGRLLATEDFTFTFTNAQGLLVAPSAAQQFACSTKCCIVMPCRTTCCITIPISTKCCTAIHSSTKCCKAIHLPYQVLYSNSHVAQSAVQQFSVAPDGIQQFTCCTKWYTAIHR